MPRTILLTVLLLLPSTLLAEPSAESQWPQWRGPLGNGTSPDGDPPLRWSETENVRFKVEIPGNGLASPIVWHDKVFVLTTIPSDAEAYEENRRKAAEKLERRDWPPGVDPVEQDFVVLALSTADGSVVWRTTAVTRTPHETHFIDSSWASGSPVTDGERLYVSFGSNGLFALDLEGRVLWSKDVARLRTRNGHGEGSSPTLHGDLLIVNWDQEEDSFLLALDKETGEERWRTPRPGEVTSWATPVVVHDQVVVPASGRSRGYTLADGKEIWSLGGMTGNVIPTPTVHGNLVFLTSGKGGAILQAVDLAKARGELEGTDAVAWTHDRHTPYVPSTVLVGGRLCFLKHNKNIFTCLDAETGEVVFTEKRVEGISNVYASPVAAAGRIYVVGRDGAAAVLAAADEYRVLATSRLDDGFDASPAVVGNNLYLRGRRYLYALTTP